ncbi:MAG: hypothetical protein JOZ39_12220, partial [Chloroflexi bacterium]|nr:hypothetical protein [Chloroflexota bacterium]
APESQKPETFSYYILKDRTPRYAVVDTDYGCMYGAYRPAAPGQHYWRVAHFLMPFYTMPPQGVLGHKIGVRAWVPLDNEHTMFYMMSRRVATSTANGANPSAGRLLPSSTDWLGRFRMEANAANDYELSRERQSSGQSFTGMTGIHLEDQAITESMGPVFDRSREHLGTSDVMVIRVRRRLLDAARAFTATGQTPPGVDQPELYGARAGGVYLPEGADWLEATSDLRRGFLEHAELDPAISGAIV